MIERNFYLGSVFFSIEDKGISEKSRRARSIGVELARMFEDRIFRLMAEGSLPAYPVFVELRSVRRGSLIEEIGVIVRLILSDEEIIVAGITATAIYKFLSDYKKLREGVIAASQDIKAVASKCLGLFKKIYDVTIKSNEIKTESEIEIILKLFVAELVAAERQAAQARAYRQETAAHRRGEPMT